ncbi:hypothetical protein BX600DRAFT_476300 [Xylariales sp. PMI_506]|nr:hypothetical protein BX600DRAFT_476300 [Xylariales sp. PMI_506]
MTSKIVIIGAGFAGVWSALSAKRLLQLTGKENNVEVLVIAPEPALVVRPRLYEANANEMSAPLRDLFNAVGVNFLQGIAEAIDTEGRTVTVKTSQGNQSSVPYDRLILAAGSAVVRPESITGLREHAFDIDTLEAAADLETHLKSLPSLPESQARNTIVVCGAGFTGIEIAAELPRRLGSTVNARIILIERADNVGPELGPGPRPVITKALQELGIEVRLGSSVTEIDAEGVVLASGERIEAMTTIWTAGVRATPLTQQVPGPKDTLSRLHVDANLRVPSSEFVFATGDAAYALADEEGGYHALMSCQHANVLGRVSGHNAAADLLGEPLVPYAQPEYNCCLDLGAWGAVIGAGWDREVKMQGDLAKRVKGYINGTLIYPPQSAEEAIIAANPIGPNSDELMQQILQAVM